MGKSIIIIVASCLTIGLFVGSVLEIKNISDNEIQSQLIFNNETTIEKLLDKNLFVILIYPYVNKAIDEYYSEYFTDIPRLDPWSYKFLSLDKLPNFNYSYIIKLEVIPYVGPHLSVGIDHITLKVDFNGVNVENHEHIENYELPPHYQNIIKNKWPSINKHLI